VTIWKRGTDNIIAPYSEPDSIDFVVIAVSDGNNLGEFVFPTTILTKKNIFSAKGKRAILQRQVRALIVSCLNSHQDVADKDNRQHAGLKG
jgi:hypothetical protein